jgi:cytochrome c oxidase accessory protein FixG
MLGFAGTRRWVYPQAIDGRFQRLRRVAFVVLQLILFGVPWISLNGSPAMRLDLPGRRLYLVGSMYTPSDAILLLMILLLLAFALFFFTSLLGRVWCGYACPQTVFLESFIHPIERWIEGERTTRIRRDRESWSIDRIWRKGAKWGLFALVSVAAAFAFIGFFVDPRLLVSGRASAEAYGWAAVIAGIAFLDFAWFREQFCTYLCPYARFQSVLTDSDSLLVGYDPSRGEPRGGASARHEGRCVACDKCVSVCPAGIDIRDGFQLECIQCARCVDACASVMNKLGHETLVQYTTLARAEGTRSRRFRPRVAAYSALLTALAASLLFLVSSRVPIEASVQRAPGSLFTRDDDGFVRNTYILRVTNNSGAPGALAFHVHVAGLPEAEVICDDIELRSAESRALPLVIRVPAGTVIPRTVPIKVHVSTPNESVTLDATFKSGGSGV